MKYVSWLGPMAYSDSQLPSETMYFRRFGKTLWPGVRPIPRSLRIQDSKTQKNADIRGCTQKFPDWPAGTRTENGTVLCHYLQLYRYFVSQTSEFCRHNTLCCFSTSVCCCCCCCLFRYLLSPETFGYTIVYPRFGRDLNPRSLFDQFKT
jgi:hypothetical protein